VISEETLAGYVLEDILTAMLQDHGYRPLVSKDQDPDALDRAGNGLVVKGRGASHQADALGELLFAIPFSLPVRLFVEAKCKRETTGIADVRNAMGVLSDVNERYSAEGKYQLPLRRHHYRYTLFSTSGFAPDAQQFALAHQISLVDLRGPAFADLGRSAASTARDLLRIAKEMGSSSFPLNQARIALRFALGTLTPEAGLFDESTRLQASLPEKALNEIATGLRGELTGKLVLGFPLGPFILVLRPDHPEKFDDFLAISASVIDVDIRFASLADGRFGEWVIVPQDASFSHIMIRFGVPPLLESWLLTEDGIDLQKVAQVTEELLQSITVFHHGNHLTRLRYEKVQAIQSIQDVLSAQVPALRQYLSDENLVYKSWRPFDDPYHDSDEGEPELLIRGPISEVTAGSPGQWSFQALAELITRLAARGLLWQSEVIVTAARTNEGQISREEVFKIARDSGPSILTRLMKLVNEITRELQRERIVGYGVLPALRPLRQGRGGQISHYEVPPEFSEFIAEVTRQMRS
jgi:hypothetical protein